MKRKIIGAAVGFLKVVIGIFTLLVVLKGCAIIVPEQTEWEAVAGLNQGGENIALIVLGITVWAVIMIWIVHLFDKYFGKYL